MTMAGYSGTPLIKKLGITDQTKVLLINPPNDYFNLLQKDISHLAAGKQEKPDLVHLFVTSMKEFEKQMNGLKAVYKANPALTIWVSWYKKSAKMGTDVTEDLIRAYALSHDLVDVKVCAVSDLWSGLKLVVPKAKR